MLAIVIAVVTVVIVLILARLLQWKAVKYECCHPTFWRDGPEHCYHVIERDEIKIPHGRFEDEIEKWVKEECCKCGHVRVLPEKFWERDGE